VVLSQGTADGASIATDDITSVHYPISKLAHGALNSATIVSTASGLPVQQQGTFTVDLGATDNGVLDAIQAATEATQAAVEGTLTVGSHAVTNAGTFAVQVDGSALTALQLIDDAVYADDEDWTDNTSKHLLVGGVYQGTPHTVTDGDVTPFLTDANGRLVVAATDNGSTLSVDDGGGALTVDGTVAVTNAGLTELAGAINASSQMDVNLAASNATVTVTGTITANLGATDNGVLDNIDADLTTLIGHADGIEGLLTTIDTDTGTLAGAVSGTEMQVDIVAALPAGTNNIGDVDVLSIVPGTGATNLGKAIDAAGGATDTGVVPLAIRDDALSALTPVEGDYVPLRTGSTGALWVTPSGTVTVDGSGVTQPISHAALTELAAAINVSSQMDVNIAASNATVAVSNAGITTIAGAVSGTEMQVDVVAALPAGTNAIGKLAANSGVDIGDVDVTSIAAGTNTIGNVGLVGRTSGGMSIFRSIDLDETEEEVKAAAGQLFSIVAFNTTAAPLYLKFYNATAANTTVGTTTPALTFVVPGNADSDGAGFVWNNEIGFAFSTAISAAVTTAVADSDTGAPGANACIVNIGYV